MKKLLILFALILSGLMFKATAQINVGINIGTQPNWGPTGYDHVDYYYLPDIDAYYNVPQRQFIYLQGNNWIFSAGLPPRYRNYDLYHCYKVVINEPRPYMHHERYYAQYAPYRGRRDQPFIRDHHDNRYNGNKHHDWDDNDNNPGRGHNRGRGRGHNKD